MKKVAKKINALVMALALAVGAVSTLNAQDLGAPSPAGNPGKWSFMGGYSYSVQDWDLANPLLYPNPPYTKRPIMELKQNRLFLQATRNLGAKWDIGLRVGLADTVENKFLRFPVNFTSCTTACGNQGKFSSNFTPYAGLSIHGLFFDGPKFGMGIVAQGNSYARFKDSQSYNISYSISGVDVTGSGTLETEIEGNRDGTIALAMQFKAGRSLVYGGPFAHMAAGHANFTDNGDITVTTITPGTPPTTTSYTTYFSSFDSAHIESQGILGGYVGVRFPSKGDWMFNVEAQWRGGVVAGFSFTRAY